MPDDRARCPHCGQVIRRVGGWKNPASAENGKKGGRPCYGVELFMLDTLVRVYRFRTREDREDWLEGAAYSAYRHEAWTAAEISRKYGRRALAEASEWEPPMSEEDYWTP